MGETGSRTTNGRSQSERLFRGLQTATRVPQLVDSRLRALELIVHQKGQTSIGWRCLSPRE